MRGSSPPRGEGGPAHPWVIKKGSDDTVKNPVCLSLPLSLSFDLNYSVIHNRALLSDYLIFFISVVLSEEFPFPFFPLLLAA